MREIRIFKFEGNTNIQVLGAKSTCDLIQNTCRSVKFNYQAESEDTYVFDNKVIFILTGWPPREPGHTNREQEYSHPKFSIRHNRKSYLV